MKLNLGCGHIPIRGYVNVDMHAAEADIYGDVRELEFEDVEEIVSYHFLEHLGYRDAEIVLKRARRWMRPGGKIVVEVPDMKVILSRGLDDPNWRHYIYGSQEHEGEYHRNGFTAESLAYLLEIAGWKVEGTREFLSEHHWRPGMPCVEVTATAP